MNWWETPLGRARLDEIARATAQRDADAASMRRQRVAVARAQQRMYASARQSRLTADWSTAESSADTELVSSLRLLRARGRAVTRDVPYGRRARTIIMNNVIHTGIGMQARVENTRRRLHSRINESIEDAWRQWCRADTCHTGGELHFSDLERAGMAQVFETGEFFVRLHRRAVGAGRIPLALELIEAERIADDLQTPSSLRLANGNAVRMGVEQDEFYRPVAYYVRRRHPGEIRWPAGPDEVMRVPAADMIHLRIILRWPQTRGEPWLHAAARKLNDMDGYVEAEIVAARGAANYMATIETDDPVGDEEFVDDGDGGHYEAEISPGIVQKLRAGEKLNFVSPNRPNAALDPFMRYMIREFAAAADLSYESLSRDYSQSNFSSSRLALQDDRDMWRALQLWWIRNFRERLHREFVQAAVLVGAVPVDMQTFGLDIDRYCRASFKPRGWTWIDPVKDVDAAVKAVKAGFRSVTSVIAENGNGQDLDDVLTEREQELELMQEAGLVFETSPSVYNKPDPAKTAPPPTGEDEPPDPGGDDATDTENEGPRKRAFSLVRST